MPRLSRAACHELLETAFAEYNSSGFIADDPISIPHSYTKLQDIEITAFWTAMLSWGRRTTIINKAKELFAYMDNAPYDFILNHEDSDLAKLEAFKHRTFQATDTLYFIAYLKHHYQNNDSLETLFIPKKRSEDGYIKDALNQANKSFFSLEFAPKRTQKHMSCPERKSTCKRLNMFLRWMVRKDAAGVDFGLWHSIPKSELMIPLDVHVDNVARSLGLLTRKQRDWQAVEELTTELRKFDPDDPVKYDYSLFGMGVLGEY